jgi:hypothetical protein
METDERYHLTGLQKTYLEDWMEKHPLTDEDRKTPTNAADELDRFIEKWCRGEVS